MSKVPTYEELLQTIIDLKRRNRELKMCKASFHAVDIASSKVREDLLTKYQHIFSLTQDLVAYVDENYIYQLVNESYSRDYNKRCDEIVGQSVADLLGEKVFSEIIKPQIDRCLEGKTVRYQAWFDYSVIGRRYRDVTYSPYRLSDGSIKGVLAVIHDLTNLKLAEEQQELEYEQLTTLINTSPDIVCFKDEKGRWLLANDADLQLFQLTGVDYKGKTDAELAHYSEFYHDAFLDCMASDEEAWEKGDISRGNRIIPIPDGGDKVFDSIKTPLFHDDGTRKGLIVQGHDITERLNTEKKLLQEIAANRQVAEVMRQKTKELEEANIALRVLLKQSLDVEEEVQQRILAQLEKAVLPYISLLRQSTSDDNGKEYFDIITSHIYEVGNSFIKKLSNPDLKLTKREILVADLVRQGKSTKEIAQLIHLKPHSVEAYRNKIRKKLQINNKKIALHQYLSVTFTSEK